MRQELLSAIEKAATVKQVNELTRLVDTKRMQSQITLDDWNECQKLLRDKRRELKPI